MQYDVYLAGPFFTPAQKIAMASIKRTLQAAGLRVFDPQEANPVLSDMSAGERTQAVAACIFADNTSGMEYSTAVIAWTDDKDTGTSFELGYFYCLSGKCRGVPIMTISLTGKPSNVMLAQCADAHFTSLDNLSSFLSQYGFRLASGNAPLFKRALHSVGKNTSED